MIHVSELGGQPIVLELQVVYHCVPKGLHPTQPLNPCLLHLQC